MANNTNKSWQFNQILQPNIIVVVIMIILTAWLTAAFVLDKREIFLPGETSRGHTLFEASCSSCHEGFKPVSNDTCMRCHEAEMAKDTHGPKKFRDPRWAELLTRIDVLTCTACHQEHVHIFSRGVHLKPDLCMNCHQGIIEGEMASHDGFTPDGCWTAGCHNFHDHRSISTGFLRKNINQPDMLPLPKLPERVIEVKLDKPPNPDLKNEFLGG